MGDDTAAASAAAADAGDDANDNACWQPNGGPLFILGTENGDRRRTGNGRACMCRLACVPMLSDSYHVCRSGHASVRVTDRPTESERPSTPGTL